MFWTKITYPIYGTGDDLLIVVSAANRRRGSFDFFKLLADYPARRVYINCADNGFYHCGAYELGHDIPQTARNLRKLVAQLRPRRVHLTGASMGGYGAMLFGSLIGADTVIAFNAGIDLNVAVLGQNVLDREAADPRYIDIAPCIAAAKSTQFYLINSNHFVRDLHQIVAASAMPNVSPILHPGGHNFHDILKLTDLKTAVLRIASDKSSEIVAALGGRYLPNLSAPAREEILEELRRCYVAGSAAPEHVLEKFKCDSPRAAVNFATSLD